jgi:hypothetical protein
VSFDAQTLPDNDGVAAEWAFDLNIALFDAHRSAAGGAGKNLDLRA